MSGLFWLFAAMSVYHCTPIRRDGRNPSSWNSEVRSLIFPRTYSPCLLSQFEELSEQSQPLLSPHIKTYSQIWAAFSDHLVQFSILAMKNILLDF